MAIGNGLSFTPLFTPDEVLLTRADYLTYALYNPLHGYYSANKVKFSSTSGDVGSTHFATHATKGIFLSYLIANLIYLNYCNAEELRDLSIFKVVELSGGNGQLAHDVLRILKAAAETKGDLWAELYHKIEWVTYEISEPLAKTQLEKNAEFVTEGKFSVKNKSALEIEEEFIAFRLSNEIWDAIPWDNFIKTTTGEILVEINVPTLYPPSAEPEDVYARSLLPTDRKFTHAISKVHWQRIIADPDFDPRYFVWEKHFVPISYFPELVAFKERYNWYFEIMPTDTVFHVSRYACALAERLANIPTFAAYDGDYADAGPPREGTRGAFLPERGYGLAGHVIHNYTFEPNVDATASPDYRLLRTILYPQESYEYGEGDQDNKHVYLNHQGAILASLLSLRELKDILTTFTSNVREDLTLFLAHPDFVGLFYSKLSLSSILIPESMTYLNDLFNAYVAGDTSPEVLNAIYHVEQTVLNLLGISSISAPAMVIPPPTPFSWSSCDSGSDPMTPIAVTQRTAAVFAPEEAAAITALADLRYRSEESSQTFET